MHLHRNKTTPDVNVVVEDFGEEEKDEPVACEWGVHGYSHEWSLYNTRNVVRYFNVPQKEMNKAYDCQRIEGNL